MSLAEANYNSLEIIPQSNSIYIHYHFNHVENFNSGTSMYSNGIGSISYLHNISTIYKNDPNIAKALEHLSQINEIKKEVDCLAELIAKSYTEPENKKKHNDKIKSILGTIKSCVEFMATAIPFYDIIAKKYGLPTILT